MGKLALLKTQADFAQFRSSRSFQTPGLRVRVLVAPNQNKPRFGFIIPKKILNKSTDRNKLKRRLKSILTKHQSKIRPVSVLLFPTASLLKTKFHQVESLVLTLFKQANLWKS